MPQHEPQHGNAESEPAGEWPLVTVNILAYNRRDEVRTTLNLLRQNLDYPADRLEILVVDNGSSDGTGDMVEREFPEVKVVRQEPNVGVAGWNAGFKAGRGKYFLVLDDDSSPERGLRKAIRHLENHPRIGALACKIVGDLYRIDFMEDNEDWIGFYGCGAILRAETIEKIGGFAAWIHLYAHEWEFGLRVLDAGYEIKFSDKCVVNHRGAGSHRSIKRARIYSTRNDLLIVYLYLPRKRAVTLLRVLLHSLFHSKAEGVRSIGYVAQGCWMFLREARRHPRAPVKPEVGETFIRMYHSTQPVLPRVAGVARYYAGIDAEPPPPSQPGRAARAGRNR